MLYFALKPCRLSRSVPLFSGRSLRLNSSSALPDRYQTKIEERLKREGVASVDEFKRLRPSEVERSKGPKETATWLKPKDEKKDHRHDASPIRPLSNFFNVGKLFEPPHTTEQISALWTAHHAKRPGCLAAVVPLTTYEKMLERAMSYPSFILPLPRAVESGTEGGEKAHEFYFMQWTTFSRPEDPRTVRNVLSDRPVLDKDSIPPCPPSSAIMFTPLAEYKLHQSYATPHLVLCNYPDLSQSHGLVLLRGDLTPTATSEPAKFRLSPADAQVLALSMQKFYVESSDKRGLKALKDFHTRPDQFNWEDVVKICDFGAALA